MNDTNHSFGEADPLRTFAFGIALLVSLASPLSVRAQNESLPPTDSTDTVGTTADFPVTEVTGTRLSDDPFLQPYAFYRHDLDVLESGVGRTGLDRINYGPGVFIQHTAPNQTSPFIRGLTGEQTLLLLDGVRFNHAFMRPGPNQYSALIPDSSLRSIDVILGSSSVVNGSDGLTGALDFNLADAGRGVSSAVSPWLRTRADFANGAILQGGVDGRKGNWAYSLDLDGRDFHDRVGGKDFESRVFGGGPGAYDEIPNTAYEQAAGAARVSYFGIENHRVDIKAGHTRQMEAARPDGYFENTGSSSRVSRFFDPQTFTYVHLRDTWYVNQGWMDSLQSTFWWHSHFEDQTREQIQNAGTATARYRLREKEDTLDAFGLDLQAVTLLGDEDQHQVTWGVTGIFENTDNDFEEYRAPVGSTDPTLAVPFEMQNWSNRTTVSDDSDYTSLGLYVQDSWDVTDTFNILGGGRFSHYEWSFGDVDGNASDATGSLRGLWQYCPNQGVFTGVSKGFRAPNLTNLNGAVDRGSSGVPAQGNPNLDPEVSYTGEVGWRWREGRDQFGVSTFYTFVDDLIQPDFGGSGEFTNIEDAEILGFETAWDIGLCFVPCPENGRLSVVGSCSLVEATKDIPQAGGGVETDNISRANRIYGRCGLRYEHDRRWWGLVQCRWHDTYDDVAEDPSDPDSSDIRLTVAGDPDGSMPGYGVVDLQLGWRSEDRKFDVGIFVENILDKTYREPGSGVDGPGRNIGIVAGMRID